MDGLAELLPGDPGTSIEINGDVYRLSMLTVRDWADMTDQVKSMRTDPLELAKQAIVGLERPLAELIVGKAWDEARRAHIVPQMELVAWTNTAFGMAYMLWLSLRHKAPDLDFKTVGNWMRPMDMTGSGRSMKEVQSLLDAVHGMPPTGPTIGA